MVSYAITGTIGHYRTLSDTIGHHQTLLDSFGHGWKALGDLWTGLDGTGWVGHYRTALDGSGRYWTTLGGIRQRWTLSDNGDAAFRLCVGCRIWYIHSSGISNAWWLVRHMVQGHSLKFKTHCRAAQYGKCGIDLLTHSVSAKVQNWMRKVQKLMRPIEVARKAQFGRKCRSG